MTNEESIKNKYPTSCCVGTSCFRGYEFRIWPTNSFFETSYLGYGITKEDAWKDAVEKQKSIA